MRLPTNKTHTSPGGGGGGVGDGHRPSGECISIFTVFYFIFSFGDRTLMNEVVPKRACTL